MVCFIFNKIYKQDESFNILDGSEFDHSSQLKSRITCYSYRPLIENLYMYTRRKVEKKQQQHYIIIYLNDVQKRSIQRSVIIMKN